MTAQQEMRAVSTVIMVYIGRTHLGWSIVTLSRISFISTGEYFARDTLLKGEKLETLLFFMAGDKGESIEELQEAIFERNTKCQLNFNHQIHCGTDF